MAIYNGRILMRKGNEADFDASKLMSGEWAVSLDKGIVRICLEAGKVIRMATYEAFEEDMKQIEAILLECQTIEEAVQRINTEINAKVEAVVEYVGQAKTYRDEALQFRNEAETFKNQAGEIAGIGIATTEKAGIVKPDGETLEADADGTMRVIGGGGVSDYSELENKPSINGTELDGEMSLENLGIASATELGKTTYKVDTIIEKADLGIKETASGEEIHLTDSAEGKAVEFALYGKAKQNTTQGNQLANFIDEVYTSNGVTVTIKNGIITLTGNPTVTSGVILTKFTQPMDLSLMTVGKTYYIKECSLEVTKGDTVFYANNKYVHAEETTKIRPYIQYNVTNYTNGQIVKPMVSEIENAQFEPYTNGASPNPSYPQEIEVSGESYNLLENTATSKTVDNLIYTVNNDKSITVNGVSNEISTFLVGTISAVEKIILSGCPTGGTSSTYQIQMRDTNNSTWLPSEYGNGKNLTLDKSHTYEVYVVIKGTTTVENLVFYPMIRKASVKNDRYMPYGKGSVEVRSYDENLMIQNNSTTSNNGVTFVQNGNIFDVYGTTPSGNFAFSEKIVNSVLPKGNYILAIDCDNNEDKEKIYLSLRTTSSGSSEFKKVYASEKRYEYVSDGTTPLVMLLLVAPNKTVNSRVKIVVCQKETLSTIPTPNGLAGIKVSSGGNYTDQSGQQWICDEIVKYADGSGKRIQRCARETFNGSENWGIDVYENLTIALNQPLLLANENTIISNVVKTTSFNKRNDFTIPIAWVHANNDLLYVRNTGFSLSEWKAYLSENQFDIIYILAEPIETPLTAEELAEISTFYPVTNISNDFDCGMRIEYVGDSIITTNTEIPVVEPKDEEELENGDNIVTLFGKIKKKLKSVGKGVVDNLLSTSTDSPLSANQGRVLDEKIGAINESLTLDYSNASEEVQDVNTLLQKLLNRFYPTFDFTPIINGLSNFSAISGSATWVHLDKTFDISAFNGIMHISFTITSDNGRTYIYGIKNGVETTLYSKEGYTGSFLVDENINASLYDNLKVKIGAFGTTTKITSVVCEAE